MDLLLSSAKKESSVSGLLHQAVFVMQTAKHRRLHNSVTGWRVVSVAAIGESIHPEGVNYTVTNRIVTVGGRTEDRSFTLRLQER